MTKRFKIEMQSYSDNVLKIARRGAREALVNANFDEAVTFSSIEQFEDEQ